MSGVGTAGERGEAQHSRMPVESRAVPRWESSLRAAALVVARLGLAYLFFTQLWWKLPPSFGCPPGYPFTTGSPASLQRTSGLCDWIGVERVWADQPHPILVADMTGIGGPRLSLDIGLLARLNGWLIAKVFAPGIGVFGWLIFFSEAFIFVSLFLGLLSRLGGLVAIGMSMQLLVGLAGISNPYEWEWSYILMVLMAFLMFAFAPGRHLGLDALLRPRLQAAAPRSGLARLLFWLT